MSDLSIDAALKALEFVEAGGEDTLARRVNLEAIAAQEDFIRHAEDPRLCPFCSVSWDQAEAHRLIAAGDAEGYERWYHETLALPVNEQGDDWGQRAKD